MVVVPSWRGWISVPRYTKLAVPPESWVRDAQAWGPRLRLSWTFSSISSLLEVVAIGICVADAGVGSFG